MSSRNARSNSGPRFHNPIRQDIQRYIADLSIEQFHVMPRIDQRPPYGQEPERRKLLFGIRLPIDGCGGFTIETIMRTSCDNAGTPSSYAYFTM